MDVEGNGHSGRIAHSLARDFNNARAHNFVLLRGDSQSCCLCYSTSVVHFHFQGGWIPCIFRGGRAKTAAFLTSSPVTIPRFFNSPSIIIDLERLKISSTRPRSSFLRFFGGRLRFIDLRVAPRDDGCLRPGNFSSGAVAVHHITVVILHYGLTWTRPYDRVFLRAAKIKW